MRLPTLKHLAQMVAVSSLLGLAACASGSRPEAMVVASSNAIMASPGDVGYHSVRSVTTAGGSETNPMWTSQVSNEALQSAVEQSLNAAGYMGQEGQPMTVQVSLMGLDQPMMGLNLNVTSRVRYTVKRGDATVFEETISATGTATVGDAFAAVERLRMANERSIQANIGEFMTRFRASVR